MMRNGNRVRRGSTLRADVCVVGAGAAGITVAQALSGSKLRVILLESGGLSPDEETQKLYRGRVVGSGQPALDASRIRYFGGTTNVWSGWCGPLDEFDFSERAWIPGSGWPLSLATLEPYYRRAHEVCDLGPWDYGESTWGRFAAPLPRLEELGVRLLLLQHSRPTRFGEKYGEMLASSDNVHVLLESNLLELVPDAGSRSIERARVGTLAGNRFSVESRVFVIACGAIENARLLLASDRVARKGIGNDRDLVGRYFLDHPRVRPSGAAVWVDDQARKLAQYTLADGVRATLALGLDLEAQRRSALTNSQFFAEGSHPLAEVPGDAYMARFLRGLGQGGEEPTLSDCWLRCEQAPNPSSRVTLSEERDALGMRRPVLDWRLQELDLHTLTSVSRLYAESLTRGGAARARVEGALLEDSDALLARVTGDWHHMGTTRMADAPERGVVDRDCRVFGLVNLYVAGASVFPTSGAMNPTLTLVALALRLADHVRTRVS